MISTLNVNTFIRIKIHILTKLETSFFAEADSKNFKCQLNFWNETNFKEGRSEKNFEVVFSTIKIIYFTKKRNKIIFREFEVFIFTERLRPAAISSLSKHCPGFTDRASESGRLVRFVRVCCSCGLTKITALFVSHTSTSMSLTAWEQMKKSFISSRSVVKKKTLSGNKKAHMH